MTPLPERSPVDFPIRLHDQIALELEGPKCPMDIALYMDLNKSIARQALHEGAKAAVARFPITGCTLDGLRFRPSDRDVDLNDMPAGPVDRMIAELGASPIDLHTALPFEQYVDTQGGRTRTLLRFHHAIADGISAFLWLGEQLRVADGWPHPAPPPESPLSFRSQRAFVRKSKYSHAGPSDVLHPKHTSDACIRAIKTCRLRAEPMRSWAKANGCTYNDVLVATAMEATRTWNLDRGGTAKKVSVWMPINVRENAFEGFGNGVSRIRVYDHQRTSLQYGDRIRDVHEQVRWCKKSGEWMFPNRPATRNRLFMWLLLAYLQRPWVDMGSISFTHLERFPRYEDEMRQLVDDVQILTPSHPAYTTTAAAMTLGDRTWVSFTYDQTRWSEEDAGRFVGMFEEHFHRASEELGYSITKSSPTAR